MSTAINWSVGSNDPLLRSPLYQKYAGTAFSAIDPITVKQDIVKALASNESAPVVSYLCWVLRVIALVS